MTCFQIKQVQDQGAAKPALDTYLTHTTHTLHNTMHCVPKLMAITRDGVVLGQPAENSARAEFSSPAVHCRTDLSCALAPLAPHPTWPAPEPGTPLGCAAQQQQPAAGQYASGALRV